MGNKNGRITSGETEAFFIRHYQQQSNTPTHGVKIDLEMLDERRVVFVSIIGLFRTWKQTPPYILYSCLVFAPFDRDWLRSPNHPKYAHIHFPTCDDPHRTKNREDSDNKRSTSLSEFVRFLKHKDQQGLVFWKDDVVESNRFLARDADHGGDALIAPFWNYVNAKLTTLKDPLKHSHYSPLKKTPFWSSTDDQRFLTQFDVTASTVLAEMYFVPLKFKSMQEILYQSNPDSLNPITCYSPDKVNRRYSRSQRSAVFEKPASGPLAGFWLSPDYELEPHSI